MPAKLVTTTIQEPAVTTAALALPTPSISPLQACTDFVAPATGGWHDSSLDLLRGLEVRDLGPVQWLDEWDGAFLPN
jgi:hypothetical protein